MSKRNKPKQPVQPSKSASTPSPLSEFTATLTMLSDWHIGSGAGRPGDVDRLVQRDADGLPYIPAKTLTGIWRDACEQVAFGLDNGDRNGAWSQWVLYLFGSQPALSALEGVTADAPRPAALSIRSAHLPKELRQALMHQPRLKEALTFVKPGIAIDARTGCTKPDFLRFEEVVRSGTVLQAEKCQIRVFGDETQKQAASALLVAGTRLVERLGAKRRRGAGHCELVIGNNFNRQTIDRHLDEWITWLENHPNPPTPDWQALDISGSAYSSNGSGEWQRIRLAIETMSPLIVPYRTVGNVVETLDYIPGTQLLKLILQRLKRENVRLDDAIAQGQIVVTNAMLQIERQPGRPVPLSLLGTKRSGGLKEGGQVYNRFAEREPEGQLKGERSGYVGNWDATGFSYDRVQKTVTTHNTVSDAEQRPMAEVGGGVYSYEAIPAGTCLQAELRLPTTLVKQLPKDWWKRLEGAARLGQSKKDDYGAVKISVIGKPGGFTAADLHSTTLTVWLLSDLLLRDDRLRPTATIDALKAELEEQLEVSLAIRQSPEDLLHDAVRQHRLESWQVSWGLPRPSLAGLAAGSCVVFELQKGKIDAEQLLRLTVQGIGERRAEGYGQICFNDPLLIEATSTCTVNRANRQNEPSKNEPIKASQFSFNYARVIERAAWREGIRRSSLAFAGDEQQRSEFFHWQRNQPSMSQLGALRSVLRHLEAVTGWLDHLEAIENRQELWADNSIEALRKLVTQPETVWELLQLPIAELTMTKNAEPDLKQALRSEAINYLVKACIRAHKRSFEEHLDESITEEVMQNGALD